MRETNYKNQNQNIENNNKLSTVAEVDWQCDTLLNKYFLTALLVSQFIVEI